jgi:two-component system sensor histidine kinase HydH
VENWYRIQSALLAAIICATLAINLLLRGRRTKLYFGFAVFNLNFVGLFLVDVLAVSETLSPKVGSVVLSTMVSMLPWTCVGFFVEFADERSRFAATAYRCAVTVSLGLIVSSILGWPPSPLWRYVLVYTAVIGSILVSTVIMARRYRSVTSPVDKARLKVLTLAGIAVFTFALVSYLPQIQQPPLGNILLAIYMFFIFEIITLRRLIDLFEFLGRFLVLAGFAIVLSLIYVILVGWWRHDFNLFLLNTVIATIVVLILFDPLRTFVELKLNELVFREKFEFTKQTDELRREMASIIDTTELAKFLLARLETSRRVTHASFWLASEDSLSYANIGFVGAKPPDRLDAISARPFFAKLVQERLLVIENLEAERHAMILAEEPEERTGVEHIEQVIHTCDAIQSDLCIGFISDRQLIGFLSIKDERLRAAYSSDEIQALSTLAGQCTITIENSRLFSRVRERYRLAALGEMAAGLAHEIRNPLGAIKGAAQLLTEDDGDNQPYIGIIEEEIQRLNGVVGQFLNYARPLKGRFDTVDINHVIERTLTLLHVERPLATIDFQPDMNLPAVKTDPELLRQIVINLAKNAVEAMEDTGGSLYIITTSCWRKLTPQAGRQPEMDQRAHVRIQFQDEGPGIQPEVMDRLFIPFYTTKTKGTGLGLAICQRIVRSLGGVLEVASNPGEGATFTMYLPVEDA